MIRFGVDCFHAFDRLVVSSDGPLSLVEFCAKVIQNAKPQNALNKDRFEWETYEFWVGQYPQILGTLHGKSWNV